MTAAPSPGAGPLASESPGHSGRGPTLSGLPADTPTLAEMVALARATPGRLRIAPRGDLEILLARAFAAPAAALFDAWTTPALLKDWLGPATWPLTACAVDLRPGGTYRFEAGHEDGEVMGWGGQYLEVSRPLGFAATERFDVPWYEGEARVALSLHEEDGALTVASLLLTYESLEARDTVLRSPMDAGLAEGFGRLEGLLKQP